MVEPQHRNTLNKGDTLERGQSLVSDNGLFRLTMQQDGNVVLYGPSADPNRGPNGTALWSSKTQGSDSQRLEIELAQLKTQSDEATFYKNKDGWNAPVPLNTYWDLRLRIEDNGNLVLYNAADNQPVWSSNTQVQIDPNKVTLVHPDGEDKVVNAAVNAAQRALQDSVDLFGPAGGTVPPPLMNDLISLGLVINPDLTDKKDIGRGTDAYNRTAQSLDNYVTNLKLSEGDLAKKIKKIDDANQGTLRKIKAEIAYLNDAMRSARPPVETDSGASGKKRFSLSDSDTQAVLKIIGDSTERVATFVNQCRTENVNAAPTITQPEPPGSPGPPAGKGDDSDKGDDSHDNDHSDNDDDSDDDDRSGNNGPDNDNRSDHNDDSDNNNPSGAATPTPAAPAPAATPPPAPVQQVSSPENIDSALEPTGTGDEAVATCQRDNSGMALDTDADYLTDPSAPDALGLEDTGWGAFGFDGLMNHPFTRANGPDLDTAVLLHALFGSPWQPIDMTRGMFQGASWDRLFGGMPTQPLPTDPLTPSRQPLEQLISKGFPALTGLTEVRPDRMPTGSVPQTVTAPPSTRTQRLPGITAPTILKWITSAFKPPITTGPGNADQAVEGTLPQANQGVVATEGVPGRGHDHR